MKTITIASRDGSESQREARNRHLAYEAALEGIVLLENRGVLPIPVGRVALYGAGAMRTIKGGTGSGEVNERHSVSIREGLEQAGFTVTTDAYLSDCEAEYRRNEDDYRALVASCIRKLQIRKLVDSMFSAKIAPAYGRAITPEDVERSDTDTALYVVSRQAGEDADRRIERGENDLAPEELAHLRTLTSAYRNVVLIINAGSSMDLSVLDGLPGIGAVVFFCQQGMEGGTALADLLSGRVSPSGRLTDTWAKRYADIPFCDEYSHRNGDTANELYREGIYVGYRYFDTFGVEPRYPFGHGLSYTEFCTELREITAAGTQITARIEVRNTGAREGREVVQAYVSCPEGTLPKEYQKLAAFAKTPVIPAGGRTEVTVCFDLCDQASFSEAEHAWILEPGAYRLRVGHSSRETRLAAVLTLSERAVVSVHEPICPLRKELNELHFTGSFPEEQAGDAVQLAVDPASVVTKRFGGGQERAPGAEAAALLKTLSPMQKLRVVVGVGMTPGGRRFNVPGSVGNTTSALYGKGLPNIVLSDGPAGLRLVRRAVLKKDGATRNVDLPFGFMQYLPRFVRRFVAADPAKGQLVYQNCTAFPVEMALAQSWNTELLHRVGEAIADEMNEYGVTYWLAPGMNIHRNPLCGRNFEYYSEDPYLTGRLAAAVTQGIQQGGGVYATIKHFCCNNQEDNRKRSDSIVSERTLREIYLRGFSIAVQSGGAKSVMTSYNKLNGVYTPNSYDLCTKVLRGEWGFDGVVMTDWLSTARGLADNALCLWAGNDLIMPGGGYELRQLRKAYRSGRLDPADLDRCAGNVIDAILASRTASRPEVRAALRQKR